MHIPIHPLVFFFLSILFTTTPTAARPSIPGAPPTTPLILPALAQSQTNTLPTSDLNYPQPKTPPPITPETADAPPLPKHRGGEGDNRRWLPSNTPEKANPLPLHKRRGISSNNLPLQQRWLPSITPLTSLSLPLPKRRGGEGDNRRWLPTSDSGLSATGIENFLTNPGGIVDNAREVLVVHGVSNGGSSGRRDE